MKAHFSRAFTLLEVMIVVTIVGILSMLAMVAVGRIKEKAARTVITNNLRQLYNAKEYYYSETGATQLSSPVTLVSKGYLSANTKNQVMGLDNLAARSGWHHHIVLFAGQPVLAYKGVKPANAAPTGETIWYPAPPSDLASYFSPNAGAGANAPATQPLAAQPAQPTPASSRLPATRTFGNIRSSGGSWESDTGFLYQLGLHTPSDRAGLAITDIKFDLPGITATKAANGYWQLSGVSRYSGQNINFTLTITNSQGGVSTVKADAPVR